LGKIIIDASVVLKWYLDNEEYGEIAIKLLGEYVSNQSEFFAPSLLEYEVTNGLIIAKRRGRIEDVEVLKALEGFINLDIKLKPLSLYYEKILHYCKIYNVSVYDGSYLALAEHEDIPFVTADKRLYNSAKKVKWVKWLGNFTNKEVI